MKPQLLQPIKAIESARSNLSGFLDQGPQLIDLANSYRLNDQLAESLTWGRWASLDQAWLGVGEVDRRAWHVLAHALLDFGHFDEAEAMYQRADPSSTNGRLQHSRARALLGKGEWAKAWRLAERRWDVPELASSSPSMPHWSGWPAVSALTLWDEQGFGDTLQALRWIPEVFRTSETVTLEVRAPLQRLLQQGLKWLGPGLEVRLRNAEQEVSGCHGSILSLPGLLHAEFWPDAEVLRLPKPKRSFPQPRIALVWEAGRYLDDPTKALEYRRKTIPLNDLELLCRAIRQRGVDLVLLQPGYDIPLKADFLEQAQLMKRCDLLLSVDTAAAHLGGAIGHPTWLLLPWASASRWQRNREDTPLYSTMRLIRQPKHGDWSGLINQLLTNLDLWLKDFAS